MSFEYCKISDIASAASILGTTLFEGESSGLSISVPASVLADYLGPVVSTSQYVAALMKGKITGGKLYYSASNTCVLEKISYHFNDGSTDSWVETSASTSITPSMTNFPAASSWSFICGDASGVISLEAATGNYNQRPTNNEFQLTGGGVGYDDIGKNGYYINGKRILRAFHKVSTTSFYFIILGDEKNEFGQNYYGSYKKYNDAQVDQFGFDTGSGTNRTVICPINFISTAYSVVGNADVGSAAFAATAVLTCIVNGKTVSGFNVKANYLQYVATNNIAFGNFSEPFGWIAKGRWF